MAVTKSHPRLKVSISIDNVAVEEHIDDDEEQKPDAVVKYIEAISGAEFSVDCELSPPWPHHSLLLDIYIDGKWMRGSFLKQSDFIGTVIKKSLTGVFHSKGQEWYVQKFCFSDIVVG